MVLIHMFWSEIFLLQKHNCIFITGRHNHLFFKNKPTNRKLTSQHPYAERFIGKPYVFTVDVDNTEDVENALVQMSSIKVLIFENKYISVHAIKKNVIKKIKWVYPRVIL